MSQSDDHRLSESQLSDPGGGPQHGQPTDFQQLYGASVAPARPGGVITAAVLGFVFGA